MSSRGEFSIDNMPNSQRRLARIAGTTPHNKRVRPGGNPAPLDSPARTLPIAPQRISLTISKKDAYFMLRGHLVHLRSKVTAPNERPYMISYVSVILTKALSLTIPEKNAYFMYWGHRVRLRSKVIAPNESPYLISYITVKQMKSLSPTTSEKMQLYIFS